MATHEDHLAIAVRLALDNVQARGGRPFGAVLVKDNRLVTTGVNTTVSNHDPTAHAELEAIRTATREQQNPRLDGHIMYASGQPCPMCLSAMYLAGIRRVFYAYSNEDGEPYGLSTRELYAELAKPLASQSMQIEHRPIQAGEVHAYEAWHQLSPASSGRR